MSGKSLARRHLLPIEPLIPLLDLSERNGQTPSPEHAVADLLDMNRRNTTRLKDGLTLWQADRVAITLGRHPVEIWPKFHDIDLIEHGTIGGFQAHYRLGTAPCDACRQASREYKAARRALKAAS